MKKLIIMIIAAMALSGIQKANGIPACGYGFFTKYDYNGGGYGQRILLSAQILRLPVENNGEDNNGWTTVVAADYRSAYNSWNKIKDDAKESLKLVYDHKSICQ